MRRRLLRLAVSPPFWVGLALIGTVVFMPSFAPLFHHWFPALERPVYQRASFVALTASHVGLVAASSAVVIIVGLSAGIFATRAAGRHFTGLIDTLTGIGQTFPPTAVLALSVPLMGYGAEPTLVALIAYGTLPVVETTVAGLRGVAPAIREAADGAGFTPLGRLLRVELPLAAPVILSGVRTAVIINIGTATIGSTVGALTLGSPIIEGLSGSNPAYVIQGAVVVGLLAIFVDLLLERLNRWFRRRARRA
jgi:osmoprotectant transport system permease protein